MPDREKVAQIEKNEKSFTSAIKKYSAILKMHQDQKVVIKSHPDINKKLRLQTSEIIDFNLKNIDLDLKKSPKNKIFPNH